jgi:acetylornithine deacetylase
VGEPTSLQPCIAQKGLLILKFVVTGTGGHAARVHENNAIYKMGAVLEKLSTIRFELTNPYVGEVKITPTMLQAGIVKNMTPDRCELIVDIRTIPEVPQAIMLNTFRDHLDVEVEVLSDRFKPTYTPESEKIAQAAQQASQGAYFGSPTASDWVFLADIPTVKMGPGHSQQSHTRDESIEITQLTRGVEVYKSIIQTYLAEDRV